MDTPDSSNLPAGGGTASDAKTKAGISALCGVLGIGVVPLILFLIEKDSRFVKFVSLQTLLLVAVEVVLYIVGFVLAFIIIGFVFWFLMIVPWVFNIILTIKSFNGETYKVPVIGDLAEKWSGGSL